jgi:hypothetical protein
LVLLENLAWTIRELSPATNTGFDESTNDQAISSGGQHQSNSNREPGKTIEPSIECIYVQNDQFFDSERPVSKAETSNFKTVVKSMKAIAPRAGSFVLSMVDPRAMAGAANGLPVFAVNDVPFWCLREFGSNLMRRADEKSSNNACLDTINSYPAHKRSLKTLGAAIDNYMKRNGLWQGEGTQSRREVVILLYSKPDDRFDVVTVRTGKN